MQLISPHHKDRLSDLRNWRVNVPMALMNTVILSLLVGTFLLTLSNWLVKNQFGVLQWIFSEKWLMVIASVFILDFTAYIWHRANHKWGFLWRFHKVHHSDTIFETTTAVRFHLGELLISLGIRIGVVIVFGIPVEGLLVFELIYQFFNIFEHGNIYLPSWIEKPLGWIFVTPALHRKHHSVNRDELNSNYATIFSFWDRLGQTFVASHSNERFTVGLPDVKTNYDLWSALKLPFFR